MRPALFIILILGEMPVYAAERAMDRAAIVPAKVEAAWTLVTPHHAGFGDGGEWEQAFDCFAKAWPLVLGNLERRFTAGPIDWSERLEQLRKLQQHFAGK